MMKKLSVCILFGGMGSEHEVSLRSAESLLNHIDHTKYNIFPVGITQDGDWIYYGGKDYSLLPTGAWKTHPDNRRATISPVRGQGLLTFEGDCVVRERIDVVFPLFHGESGKDTSIHSLLQLSGIPCVGSHAAASAVAMDATLTKLVADQAGVPQAAWHLVHRADLEHRMDNTLAALEKKLAYPMLVSGSSAGASMASDRDGLLSALQSASLSGSKVLVEEGIHGQEVAVAVMGNDNPVASICGEIAPCSDFPDSEAGYVTGTSVTYIPARISEEVEELVREAAVKVYSAVGCRGLSRVDFFVTSEDNRVVFRRINTTPDFASTSMYPRLFAASGISYSELIDELLKLAQEAYV